MCPPPIGPSSELTHAGRPYELTLLVSTVLVDSVIDEWHGCVLAYVWTKGGLRATTVAIFSHMSTEVSVFTARCDA